MSVSFLKHYNNFSITFNIILRSIYGTNVDSVIIFNILKHPKIVKSKLKLEIRSVERGICPIATSTMNELFSYNYGA